MYGNGSTHRGREERYNLWFDPSKEFHRYSILWTNKNIIFYIDDVPIREIVRNDAMGGEYPSKPMGLYATIWDASDWATSVPPPECEIDPVEQHRFKETGRLKFMNKHHGHRHPKRSTTQVLDARNYGNEDE
ncbi:putative xyloglucan endotransglucosylase/hydrolase protein 30 [Datura stramonium]|uniref:Xyloglucan endotransglucosylase/hydrolase protein 30 n=1 Tax=Datura stramonium TaxID=4076 RepID=A0ABS8RJY1_DATST|nr:putative xyloglucan endotransglucosylase/hydrolase protein 30 [Datura stramonium]